MNYKVKNIYGKANSSAISVSVPGSKSITARALLIAALSCGESTLNGVQFSDDCQTFLSCLKELGIACSVDGTTVRIKGCCGRLPARKAEINVGSAGTAARFLPALLAFHDGEYKVSCSEQMKKRPVLPLISALKGLGAELDSDSFPFTIRGTRSPEAGVSVDVSESSQFLSALLISAVCAPYPVKIMATGTHGLDYVGMTLRIMRAFGGSVVEDKGVYTVSGGYSPLKYDIEPDASAACYFYALNRILGTNVSVNGLPPDSMQGDVSFIRLIEGFNGGRLDMRSFSDQALTLAAIAPYFGAPTEICGVEHIRKQECDRISAMVANLTAMGVKCEERADGVKIYPSQPGPARIKTFGDHRVAMSFALTGLRADGIVIEDAEVCSKTFKEYFAVLDALCVSLAG